VPKIELRDRTLRDVILGRDSYILLFVLLIVDYLVLSLIESPRWAGLLHLIPITLSVLLGLHTSEARPRTIRYAALVLGLSLVASVVQVFADDHQVGSAGFFLFALILAVTSISILGQVLSHRHVNIETMFGAIDVYILIGLFFASLYLGIADATAHRHAAELFSQRFFAQPGPHPNSDYLYFSFIVLTTVGFGDLTPHTELARTVVVLEALVGQIFLVTLVARLVSLFGLVKPEPGIELDRPAAEITPDPFTAVDPNDPGPA
jgi:Ion channel